MSNLVKKLKQGTQFFTSPETWRLVLDESRRGPRKVSPGMSVESIEDDAAAGLRLVSIGGKRYWLPATMDWRWLGDLYPEVFCPEHPHYYEYRGCRLRPGDVVVDAGASEGFFTRFALDRGAKVIAVEPWAPMAEALRRTFATEIADGRLVVEATSLTDHEGQATLHFDPRTPWGASLMETNGDEQGVTVAQTTLDTLIAGSPWGRCDFLKMDIEGVERQAIAGAAATLRRDKPCLSIAVYHHSTGYLNIRRDLQAAALGYHVTAKGLLRRRWGIYIPMVLHAWTADRDETPTSSSI